MAALADVVPAEWQILVSDEEDEKLPLPCVVLRVTECNEILGPQSGVYELLVSVMFRSHPKETTSADRAEAVTLVDLWAHGDPAPILSSAANFHCYGFTPVSGELSVDPERRSYDFSTIWRLWCMPSDNS